MIVRARTVVTMNGPPIDNGAVAVSGDRIAAVGPAKDVLSRFGADVIDLGEQILLPGLINAHCHLDYTLLRGKIPRKTSFTDWIRAINAEKAKIAGQEYVESIKRGFIEARQFGTTSVANLTAFPDLIAQINEPIRTWWFAELIDVRDPKSASDLVDRAAGQLKSKRHWGLAPHAPFTASANVYRRCEEIARRENILLTTHLAESSEEMQMSFDLDGPLAGFLAEINPDLFEYNGQTPVEHVLDNVCSLDSRWLVVHLNSIVDSDVELLADQPTRCHVIHCPRSHQYFGHERFEFEKLRGAGLNVCLGTDSLASNDDLSLFAEMRLFRERYPAVSCREIVELVTVNPGRALHHQDLLGQIAPNFYADLISIPSNNAGDVFENIVAHQAHVVWAMLGGQYLGNCP
jgi:cytosine/adenosine deaminase-related metal-dependent hydrolase